MLVCWGYNQFGQTTVPIAFRKAHVVKTSNHTCSLALINGKSRVGCWGENSDGQTVVPDSIYGGLEDLVPGCDQDQIDNDQLDTKKEIVSLSVGIKTSAGVDTNGEIYIWGRVKSN